MGISEGYGIGSLKPGVCTSSTRPASPFDGQVVYMTDVDQTAIWDGSAWVGLDPSRDRNVVINGAMQIAQRGTSTAGITGDGFHTADRFKTACSGMGTFTQSIENDAPTGSGFRKSLKMLCTTADASPSGTDNLAMYQSFEGQNVQQFLKGTASAKSFAVSFWVKSNVTGTYIAELFDTDNNRQTSISYTINVSATWEKKTIIFASDTTGAFDNDNAASLQILFWLGAGPSLQSGTLQTTWASATNAYRAVGQTNLASAINNAWQITGVQLEVGAVATPFEFEDIGETLAKCQRYFQKSYSVNVAPATNASQAGLVVGGTQSVPNNGLISNPRFHVSMRTAPTITIYSYTSSQLSRVSDAYNGIDQSTGTVTTAYAGDNSFMVYNTSGITLTSTLGLMHHYTASAEL